MALAGLEHVFELWGALVGPCLCLAVVMAQSPRETPSGFIHDDGDPWACLARVPFA